MFSSCLPLFQCCQRVPKISISRASIIDQDEIIAVAKQAFEETYPNSYDPRRNELLFADFKKKNCHFFIAKSNGKIIGFAKMLIIKTEGDNMAILDKLYILEEHHGLGYGSALMKHCLNAAAEHHATTMDLMVWDLNETAIRFYEKFHFTKGRRQQVYDLDGDPLLGQYGLAMHCDDISLNFQKRAAPSLQ